MKTLGILGCGDLGQQIAHYALTDNHYAQVVFFDDYTDLPIINGNKVLGRLSEVIVAYDNGLFDELIVAIGYKHLKEKKHFFEKFSKLIPFGTIVHSTSWVDKTSSIGAGCVIYPHCIVDAKVNISDNTLLNVGCTIAHDTRIGEHVFLSPRVAIAGFVNVESLCILGINCTIIDNINICSGTQIGGGAIVIKSIERKGLYVGNPAKFIR